MLETASNKRQRRRAGTSSPTGATDGMRQDERDLSPSLPGTLGPPSESRMNRIARRAHEIYEGRGGVHGKALEDWLQAEREIDSALSEDHGSDG
jgi:hypothetical protein